MANMSCTVTETHVSGGFWKVVWSWISDDAAGTASGATSYALFTGKLIGLGTIPGAAGLAPDDNYDVTILDADGHDVLLGAGMNRDTANTEYQPTTSLGAVLESALTLNVSGAGNANAGTVILWIQEQVC